MLEEPLAFYASQGPISAPGRYAELLADLPRDIRALCRVVQGVLNQGDHPTVPGGLPTIEIHLFDFDEELYDQRVRVRYLHFIRPELTFDTKEAMRVEMMEDIRIAKEWFAAH